MSLVSFYRAKEYSVPALQEMVNRIAEDQGGWESLLKNGKKVVIKPNLVIGKKPEACATTHPALLEAVILCLLPFTREITVAECPGGPNTEILLSAIYRETGVGEVCKKYQIPMEMEMTPVSLPVPRPQSAKEVDILKAFTQADVFINLAKMKTHSLTCVSGAAKNLYGTVPGLKKVEYHATYPHVADFAGLICDINQVLRPTLSIVDGIWGMEKDGPTGGVPKFAGGILAGRDPFAVDEVMCRFMGIDPALSPILVRAKEAGLFDGVVEVVGDDMESAKPSPFILPDSQKRSILRSLPDLFGGKLVRYLSPRPLIEKNKCIGCGECARLCPQKTIVIEKRRAKIIQNKCIRCWCCQEMCPKKAVRTHSHPILKLF